MLAVYNGHKDITKILVMSGADVDITNKDGDTALTLAEKKGDTAIVKLLKQAKAGAFSSEGVTAHALSTINNKLKH